MAGNGGGSEGFTLSSAGHDVRARVLNEAIAPSVEGASRDAEQLALLIG